MWLSLLLCGMLPLALAQIVSHPSIHLLPLDSCGLQTLYPLRNRIFGGAQAELGDFPWLAALQYSLRNGQTAFLCGGALINNRFILTAAHCIIPTDSGNVLESVRLGEHNLETLFDCALRPSGRQHCAEPFMDFLIERTIPHPLYRNNLDGGNYDIGLLKLTEIVPMSDFVTPICLPLDPTGLRSYEGELLEITGWGSTETDAFSNVKRVVKVPVQKLVDCARSYGQLGQPIFTNQLCAGGVNGQDACAGDSGGPLMGLDNSYRYRVVAVASFGTSPCAHVGWPGVYTRVDYFMEWILDHLGN